MAKRRDTKPTRYPGIASTEGGHVVRARVRDPRTGRERDLSRFVAGSLRDARRAQDEMRTEVRELGTVSRTRLSAYAEQWLERKAGTLRPHTLARYAVALTEHIFPTLGEWYLDALTPDAIVAWLGDMQSKTHDGRPYNPRTINGWLRVLRTMLADAFVERRLGPSPASRVHQLTEAPVYTDEDPNILSAEDLGALLLALRERSPVWFALFTTKAMLGLRTSEVTALKWSDIDGDTLKVQRSAVRGHVDERTKTKRTRSLPMPPAVVAVLAEQRARLEAAARAASQARGEIVPCSRWVFPSATDAPRYGSTLAKPLRAAMRAAGLERRLTPHGLRRTLNDVLRLVASADVQRAIVGHSSEKMSEHYSWVTPSERAGAIARVADVVKLEAKR
jgi:integrase